jgi:hypothetical protein
MRNASAENLHHLDEEKKQPPAGVADKVKARVIPGIVFALGYMLSPLSWWNDAFINLPLAYVLGNVMNFFVPGSFEAAMIAAYWMSNLAGILFMFWAGSRLLGKTPPKRREIAISIAVSLLYTLAIYFLMQWDIVRPFQF